MKSCSICLLVYLFLSTLTEPIGLASSFQTQGKQSPNSAAAGIWILTREGDTDGRRIRFSMNGTQLNGSYFTQKHEEKTITSARLDRGYLYFKVPELQLYFEMRLVGDRFEGKMTVYSSTEKRAPELVRMTRQK